MLYEASKTRINSRGATEDKASSLVNTSRIMARAARNKARQRKAMMSQSSNLILRARFLEVR